VIAVPQWTLQDQLDWELLRDADADIASEVAARRPDLVDMWERAVEKVNEEWASSSAKT